MCTSVGLLEKVVSAKNGRRGSFPVLSVLVLLSMLDLQYLSIMSLNDRCNDPKSRLIVESNIAGFH
jgi:hypothetical protein